MPSKKNHKPAISNTKYNKKIRGEKIELKSICLIRNSVVTKLRVMPNADEYTPVSMDSFIKWSLWMPTIVSIVKIVSNTT